MFDSKGLIHSSRTDLDGKKIEFANETVSANTSLAEALVGADVFIGLSKGNILNQEMVRSMAKDCIVFAMANPNPEISYEEAMGARKDIIFATGRSEAASISCWGLTSSTATVTTKTISAATDASRLTFATG